VAKKGEGDNQGATLGANPSRKDKGEKKNVYGFKGEFDSIGDDICRPLLHVI